MNTKEAKVTSSKSNKSRDVTEYNDQLGENASEEFKSDEYSNSLKSKGKNKGFK